MISVTSYVTGCAGDDFLCCRALLRRARGRIVAITDFSLFAQHQGISSHIAFSVDLLCVIGGGSFSVSAGAIKVLPGRENS